MDTHRYLARLVLEACTPLFVGSGNKALLKNALVQRDHHGFPMIQGSSLAGVLRHALEDKDTSRWRPLFGYQEEEDGLGSRIKVSSAYLLLEGNQPAEGLSDRGQSYRSKFEELPLRQHVRISHKGVAEVGGKFDNEVVYRGCRFVCELEMRGSGSEAEKKCWQQLLQTLKSPLFRLGQGTRNGYGLLTVDSCRARCFDLRIAEDFDAYLHYDPSFCAENGCLEEMTIKLIDKPKWWTYQLALQPDGFFHFGAGYGDEEVDLVPVSEEVVRYKAGQLQFEERLLMPAASIKGALRHRVCYHYNKLQGIKAEEVTEPDAYTGAANEAVRMLFGAEAGSEWKEAGRGRLLMDDQHLPLPKKNKLFNHVAIDRFTGGALDGALFSEKVNRCDNLFITIHLERPEGLPDKVKEALRQALLDVSRGLLPLGGMNTKGHGIFQGQLYINGEKQGTNAN